MSDARPMQVRCPFCATLIPAQATVCGYCERPLDPGVPGRPQPDQPGRTGSSSRASRAHRISLRFVVGILFGLICLAMVIYGVYVMSQA